MGIDYRSGADGYNAFGRVPDNKTEEVPILSGNLREYYIDGTVRDGVSYSYNQYRKVIDIR